MMILRFLLKYCLALIVIVGLCSCTSYKSVPYFQNAAEFDGSTGARLYDMKVKPKDELSINVFSGNDREAVAPFNIRDPHDVTYRQGRIAANSGMGQIHYYIVDQEGNIDFPILGKIHVANMTLDQVSSKIKGLVTPYLQPSVDCVVTTIINNYNITVMGEVARPNTFTISKPKINVIEALAKAGDMTIYGKRDNVKILRELADGTYEVHELDLRDANILNSPYYYLEQRDIVYVEPNVVMAQESKVSTTTRLWFNGASIIISVGSLLYRVLK